jgi:hypothetical protein
MVERIEQRPNINLETNPITKDSLLADNQSQKAVRRRKEVEVDEANNSQLVVIRCGDARYILTYRKAIAISSIAAGGPKELFRGVFSKDGAPGIIALPHDPCGGLGVKSILAELGGLPENPSPIERFAHNHVTDEDALVTAARTAKNVSLIVPDKLVLAAIHKQETGDILPLAVYKGGKHSFSKDIPETFSDFLKYQQRYISSLKKQYPNLAEIQKNQNPELMVIGRDTRPLEVILPEITRKPGSAFRIMSSRPSDGNLIDSEDMQLIKDQATYPLTHFDKLSKILILAESMDASREMARRLMEMQEARVWMAKSNSEIYIARSKQGEIKEIYDYSSR